MITYLQGKQIAEKKIKALEHENDASYILVESMTIDTEKLWIFYYALKPLNSSEELSMRGNPPIAVEKSNGQVYATGIAQSIEYYIKRIEEGFEEK